MHIYDADATHALLPYDLLAEEVRAILRDKRSGTAYAPQRLGMPLAEGGILLAMPAADDHIAITKLVTVHPRNGQRSLPSIHGEVVVMRANSGERLAILDGKAVTARRTAAVSLLAAKTLASAAKHGPILIIGAGTQGRAHLEAFGQWLPHAEVFIASRTPAPSEVLAAHGRALGLRAQALAMADMDATVPRCGLLITGTTSTVPLFADHVRDGAMVIAVGAYSHSMCELPHALVRRAAVFVDTLEGAQHEAGDLSQAGIDWATVTALEDVVEGQPTPRPSLEGRGDKVAVFKSVGHALWDLAAARLAVRAM